MRRRIAGLPGNQDLLDPTWALELDDFDEPPLIYRIAEVEFLRPLPVELRCALMLECGLERLLDIERIVRDSPAAEGRKIFAEMTVGDWEGFEAGEVTVPTPRIFVHPVADEVRPGRSFTGLRIEQVQQWLASISGAIERVRVDESGESEAGTYRVHVGLRQPTTGRLVSSFSP